MLSIPSRLWPGIITFLFYFGALKTDYYQSETPQTVDQQRLSNHSGSVNRHLLLLNFTTYNTHEFAVHC